MITFRHIGLTTSLVLGIGCDAQPDGDYQGEPLITIKGTITAFAGALDAVEAALIWWQEEEGSPTIPWTTVPVAGSFPASFTLDIYTPPPDDVMVVLPESPPGTPLVTMGIPGMVRAGAQAGDPSAVLAVSSEYALLYAEGPLDWPVIGHVSRGYHLLRFDSTLAKQCLEDAIAAGATPEDAAETCADVPVQVHEIDAATPISLAFE